MKKSYLIISIFVLLIIIITPLYSGKINSEEKPNSKEIIESNSNYDISYEKYSKIIEHQESIIIFLLVIITIIILLSLIYFYDRNSFKKGNSTGLDNGNSKDFNNNDQKSYPKVNPKNIDNEFSIIKNLIDQLFNHLVWGSKTENNNTKENYPSKQVNSKLKNNDQLIQDSSLSNNKTQPQLIIEKLDSILSLLKERQTPEQTKPIEVIKYDDKGFALVCNCKKDNNNNLVKTEHGEAPHFDLKKKADNSYWLFLRGSETKSSPSQNDNLSSFFELEQNNKGFYKQKEPAQIDWNNNVGKIIKKGIIEF